MPTSSAAPEDLAAYARTGLDLDAELAHRGRALRDAVERFAAGRPEHISPRLDLAGAVVAKARRDRDLDEWVRGVGEAFLNADRAGAGSPGVKRVDDRSLPGGAPGSTWDPRANVHRGSEAAWEKAVHGNNPCAIYEKGHYRGGGFITHPDGRDFPLVVPTYRGKDGKVWNADYKLGKKNRVTDLGNDRGWRRVGRPEEGLMYLGDDLNAGKRFLIGLGGSAGGSPLHGTAVEAADYKDLQVSDTGAPFLAVKGKPLPKGGPPQWYDESGPHLGWPTTAANAADLAVIVGEGAVAAMTADNNRLARYQVVFEEHADGRRRAFLRVFHIREMSGGLRVWPSQLYFENGELTGQNLHYRDAPKDRDTPGYRLVQLDD